MAILEFVVLPAVAWAVGVLVLMRVLSGLGWNELRSALLHRVYKSFTFDGEVIPGTRPHPIARLVLRVLSPEDDGRKQLVLTALAPQQPQPPHGEQLPGEPRTATS